MVSVDRRRHTQIGMTAQIAAIARAGAHASGDELGGFVPAPLRSHAHPECHHQRAGDHMEEQLLVVPLRAVCWPAKLGNCGGVEEFSVVVADTIHLRADLFLVHVLTLGPGCGQAHRSSARADGGYVRTALRHALGFPIGVAPPRAAV